ncbi:MAG: sensor histidine kinase [Ruminococcus sp.]
MIMNKKLKKENRKILASIISIVLFICLLAMSAFTYLIYDSTKSIELYQAELRATNLFSSTSNIDITQPNAISAFITTKLNEEEMRDVYISLENDYYNISVDTANKCRIETDDFTGYSDLYLDYFTLRESMTDEQYNKISDYLSKEPDENGNYYILSVNQYASDYYLPISTGQMIPIRLEILRTNDKHSWYVEDEHIEFFELSSDKIDEIKRMQKEDEENYKKNYSNDDENTTYFSGLIYSVGEMRKNEISKDFFFNGGTENELKKYDEENPFDPGFYSALVILDNFNYIYREVSSTNPAYILSVYEEGEEISYDDMNDYNNKICNITIYQKLEPLNACMPTLIIGNIIILVFFIIAGTIMILIVWRNLRNRAIREQHRIEMTNAVAHNLKTPLCVINGFSENLREEEGFITKQHYIDVIQQQAGDMDILVHKMLDFSRLEAGSARLNKKPFGIKQELEKLAEKYGNISDKSIIVNADDKEINADKELMELVFENLTDNAVKYARKNSDIEISFVNNCFSISNECEEISKKELKRMWKPYNRLEKDEDVRGTGIGLAIVKQILRLHKIKPTTEYSDGRLTISFFIKTK